MISPLEGYNFEQAIEEVGQNQKIKIVGCARFFAHHLNNGEVLYQIGVQKKMSTPYMLLTLTLIPIKQADDRVIFVGPSARTV